MLRNIRNALFPRGIAQATWACERTFKNIYLLFIKDYVSNSMHLIPIYTFCTFPLHRFLSSLNSWLTFAFWYNSHNYALYTKQNKQTNNIVKGSLVQDLYKYCHIIMIQTHLLNTFQLVLFKPWYFMIKWHKIWLSSPCY